jgi:hypothetical protein
MHYIATLATLTLSSCGSQVVDPEQPEVVVGVLETSKDVTVAGDSSKCQSPSATKSTLKHTLATEPSNRKWVIAGGVAMVVGLLIVIIAVALAVTTRPSPRPSPRPQNYDTKSGMPRSPSPGPYRIEVPAREPEDMKNYFPEDRHSWQDLFKPSPSPDKGSGMSSPSP